MVYEIQVDGGRFYACEACGLIYNTPIAASSCEEWCTSHGTCNTTIASKAIGRLRKYTGKTLRLNT